MVINVHVAENGQGAASNDNDEIWRPVRFHTRDASTNENDRRAHELLRTLRSLLNKLSPVNFCKIVSSFKALILENSVMLDQIASVMVEKAIAEPLFSKWYVELLCSVSDGLESNEIEESIPFRILMLFTEKLISVFDELRSRETVVQNREIVVIEGAELEEQFNETEFRFRRNFVGTGRVIALSFTHSILSFSTLNRCIQVLLSSPEETSLKCLCELMTTVGKFFEFHLDDAEINEYFEEISKISQNSKLSTKSRFMLLNLLEYKMNSWTSRTVLKNLEVVGKLLSALSELYAKKDETISVKSTESDFLIDTKEAQLINDILNKFTRCPRNLAAVLNVFSELTAPEKSKLVNLIIMCVTKGDIYSDDCGKLFAILIQSKHLLTSDVILGIKTVILGYCKNAIFAVQQIWIRLRDMFHPLLVDEVFSLDYLEDDVDIRKAKKLETVKEKQTKKKFKSESQESKLSWRRGLPVTKRSVPKEPVEVENKEDESKEIEDNKSAEDES